MKVQNPQTALGAVREELAIFQRDRATCNAKLADVRRRLREARATEKVDRRVEAKALAERLEIIDAEIEHSTKELERAEADVITMTKTNRLAELRPLLEVSWRRLWAATYRVEDLWSETRQIAREVEALQIELRRYDAVFIPSQVRVGRNAMTGQPGNVVIACDGGSGTPTPPPRESLSEGT